MSCTYAVFECCLYVSVVSHELICDLRLYSCGIEEHLTWRVLMQYLKVCLDVFFVSHELMSNLRAYSCAILGHLV